MLRLDNLGIQRDGRWILRDISLQIDAGQIITLVGPNGCGKTTLLRALLGLTPLSTGRIEKKPGLRIGYMPQKLHIEPTLPLTVARFLSLGPAFSQEVLDTLRVTSLLDKSMHVLSGGELQRVLLARALMNNPEFLVLDEPLQGVDVNGQAEFYRHILDARARLNCSILMVSHDLHVVMAKTDQVVCLNHHICCSGTPEAVKLDPAFIHLFGESAAFYAHKHDHQHDE
ncbi:MAG: ATP-binding cassette domain-containing protein [Gammaproteobacteria bacterium]